MSNTLNTPIEALELEFPLRMTEYSLRRGSGGRGRSRGGDGVVRELEALAPLSYSLITERRRHAPPGAEGGRAGRARAQPARRRGAAAEGDGTIEPGQRLRIETPGGGGSRRSRHHLGHESARRVPRTGDHGLPDGRQPGRAGFELTVWNRTEATAEQFVEQHGATLAATPAQAAAERRADRDDGGRRRPGRSMCCSGEDGASAPRARARCASTARRSARRRLARSPPGWPNAR